MPERARRGRLLGRLAVAVVLGLAPAGCGDDTEAGADAPRRDRFAVGSVTVELDGSVVTLSGSTPSTEAAETLVDSLFTRDDVTVVINHLGTDEAATTVALTTFHTGIDALRGVRN